MLKYFFIFMFLVGCGSKSKKNRVYIEGPTPSYQAAVKSYTQFKYEDALAQVNMFLETRPHSQRYKEALYLKGKIFKQMQRPEECVETFSKVIDISKMSKDTYYMYSLYFSGICYELMGDITKAIASYQDAMKSKNITRDLKELEIPARLAIAYSRTGENEVSRKYYDKTKKELALIKKAKNLDLERRQVLSEILFNMGTLTKNFSTGDDFENYLNSIRLSQEYLVLVLRLDSGGQSEVAIDLIIKNFSSVYAHIENLPIENLEDEVLASRQRQEARQKLASILIENIDVFESLVLPEEQAKVSFVLKSLETARSIKKNLEKIIAERPMGEGLTPDAERLRSPKLPIKIYDKKTKLENESKNE